MHRMTKYLPAALAVAFVLSFAAPARAAEPAPGTPAAACVECHAKSSPGVVADWRASRHFGENVGCIKCHGGAHTTATDAANARMPTPETCGECHADRVEQFGRSKHAKSWVALNAMPTAHGQPAPMIAGQKGCGGCHKIGLKTAAEQAQIVAAGNVHGNGSCDACHTRHTFSVKEAREPQACQTCHMGFDHPQWEMYSTSKHGTRHSMKQLGILPAGTSAPTCQNCHMPNGDHNVGTAWGFLAVRLPLPEDKQWAADQVTILQGLGVLDPAGKPTARLDVVKAGDVARLDQASWQTQRDRMITACSQCHSKKFAQEQMQAGDDMIKAADHLMAEGIRVVAGLYADGTLKKPANYAAGFPDLLTFHDAPTVIEQTLFTMFLEHRMRTFQGTFHASPDYAMWYGWSEMQRDLTEIRELAASMRRERGVRPAAAGARPGTRK
ncbi:MAG: multiheme c-type cytochrome [Candidatus Eisenbacteria bacterium]